MPFKKSTISAIIIIVSLATIFGLSGLNFLFPSNTQLPSDLESNDNQSTTVEKISLTTKDNIKITANIFKADNPKGWLVLVHIMPQTKESWSNLAKSLQSIGYESIAIDLRGHGESDGGPDGYLNFSDADHQKSISDLEAAVDYLLENRNATSDKISFIGASIGANLSLRYISEHSEFKKAILLSAGLNYRGIKTEPLVKNLKTGQGVFLISSRDDASNAEENQKLYDSVPSEAQKKIQIYESGGHGTDILINQPSLLGLIVEFPLRVFGARSSRARYYKEKYSG